MNKRGQLGQNELVVTIIAAIVLILVIWGIYSVVSGGQNVISKIAPDALTVQSNLCKTLYLPQGESEYCKYRAIELENGQTGYVNCDYEPLRKLIDVNPLQGTCATKGYTADEACNNLLSNPENKANKVVYFKDVESSNARECNLVNAKSA